MWRASLSRMDRRKLLAGVAGGGLAVLGGPLGHVQADDQSQNSTQNSTESGDDGSGNVQDDEGPADLETEFELLDPEELDLNGSPEIYIEENTAYVYGTVQYASSTCGTVKLAHAGYEESQGRVDVVVVAADAEQAEEDGAETECTDDVAEMGYRAVVAPDGEFNRVVVSEHGAYGTNSASVST